MSDDLTSVPTCSGDPCIIGAPPAPESVCSTGGLEDPQQRLRNLELENKQLKSDMRDLERQIRDVNTAIGLLRAADENFDARITALENGTGGVSAEIDALKVRMTDTENATTTNAANIASNDTDIADIYARGVATVTSPSEILSGFYLDGAPFQSPVTATVSYLMDELGNILMDEFGNPLLAPNP